MVFSMVAVVAPGVLGKIFSVSVFVVVAVPDLPPVIAAVVPGPMAIVGSPIIADYEGDGM